MGYALHVGVILPKKEMEGLFDKIDSIVSQADEVDGQYHQFEGGLTLTGKWTRKFRRIGGVF